jgi:glutamate dehydrogenase
MFEQKREHLVAQNVPDKLATEICRYDFLLPATSFIEISELQGEQLASVVDIYYAVGENLQLNWLAKVIDQLPVANYWQARARETYQDDLAWQQRALTNNVVNCNRCKGSAKNRVSTWVSNNEKPLVRVRQVLVQLESEAQPDYAMFSVVLRELLNLSQSTA